MVCGKVVACSPLHIAIIYSTRGMFSLWLFGLVGAVVDGPQKIIIDTDMGFDVDDVGAVCLGNALMAANKTGEYIPRAFYTCSVRLRAVHTRARAHAHTPQFSLRIGECYNHPSVEHVNICRLLILGCFIFILCRDPCCCTQYWMQVRDWRSVCYQPLLWAR